MLGPFPPPRAQGPLVPAYVVPDLVPQDEESGEPIHTCRRAGAAPALPPVRADVGPAMPLTPQEQLEREVHRLGPYLPDLARWSQERLQFRDKEHASIIIAKAEGFLRTVKVRRGRRAPSRQQRP